MNYCKYGLKLPLFMLSVLILPFSCKNPQSDYTRDNARKLYEETKRVAENYYDSIGNVSDSASLYRIKAGFGEALTKVNYRFPADTYLYLSDGENDTIIHMIDSVVKLIGIKESTMSIKDSLPPDSAIVYRDINL